MRFVAALEPQIRLKSVNKSAPDKKNDPEEYQPLYPKLDQLLAELPAKYVAKVTPMTSNLYVPMDKENGYVPSEASINRQVGIGCMNIDFHP